jgi:hypothetical protein
MKFTKISITTALLLSSSLFATPISLEKDKTINIYGVSSKINKDKSSSNGLGFMYDSETIKAKIETTSDFIKFGSILKFNPTNSKWYIKTGINYINQKLYVPDNTNAKVSQYSGAFATGYMIKDDLYIELGSSLTKLNGKTLGSDYKIVDETTKIAYLELVKRYNLSYGTIDISANGGKSYYEFKDDETSYGLGIDYYPSNDIKIGYNYQNEKDNISNKYSFDYGYFFTSFQDNISTNTYDIKAGVKIAFNNLFDTSTYKKPTNIKPHLSELHRFENIVFNENMSVQSSKGVEKEALLTIIINIDTPLG